MFGDSITDDIKSRYTILELDTFYFPDIDKNRTAYCLIENTPIMEMFNLDKFQDLHNNLMRNYRLKNWKFCEDALEHLTGRWNREADTFYETLSNRIAELKEQELDTTWDGVIRRNS